MWRKLEMNPKTRQYLYDPYFVDKMKQLQNNPQLLKMYLMMKEPRIIDGVSVMLGFQPGALNNTHVNGSMAPPPGDWDREKKKRRKVKRRQAKEKEHNEKMENLKKQGVDITELETKYKEQQDQQEEERRERHKVRRERIEKERKEAREKKRTRT